MNNDRKYLIGQFLRVFIPVGSVGNYADDIGYPGVTDGVGGREEERGQGTEGQMTESSCWIYGSRSPPVATEPLKCGWGTKL